MVSIRSLTFVCASLFATIAACGGAPPAPVAAPAPGDSAAPSASVPAPAPASAVWRRDASKDEQVAFMKTHVLPRMSKVFQAHDATRYGEFSCKTCHGPAFKEPKEFLPHLTLKDGNITSFADKPEISKWMAEKVAPEMATAMGMKPYDMKTHEGFGCGGCHTIDMK